MPFGEFLEGKTGGLAKVSPYGPQQTAAFDQLLSSGLQGLQNPYAGFDPIAKQRTEHFQQQIVPSLAARFAGTGGRSTSPVFASQLGAAGRGLESDLAALQANYGLQNQGQLLNMLQLGLTPQNQFFSVPAQPGFGPSFLQQAGPAIASAGTSKVLDWLAWAARKAFGLPS